MAEVGVGSPAPEISLLRTDGSTATLRELCAGESSVLFFLRHYG